MPATPWIVGKRCSVRVPATSANLGPGFDSLGLALGLYDVVEAEIIDGRLEVEVDGRGRGSRPARRGASRRPGRRGRGERVGPAPPPGLRLLARNAIPHGRGLGSSAAAVVAGVTLAEPAGTR